MVGVIWFVSLTTMIPTFIEYQKHEQHVNGSNWTVLVCGPGSFPQEFSIFNGFFYLCVSYIIPQLVIYSCYAHVIFFVWIKAKAKEESGEGALASSVVSKGKKRIIIMLLVVAAMFAVSWAPYFVVQTISVRHKLCLPCMHPDFRRRRRMMMMMMMMMMRRRRRRRTIITVRAH